MSNVSQPPTPKQGTLLLSPCLKPGVLRGTSITELSKEIGYTLVILPAQKLTEMTMHSALFHVIQHVILAEYRHIEQTQRTIASMKRNAQKRRTRQEEAFKLSQVLVAFTSLPRVLKLVWSTDAFLTIAMGLISLVRGVTHCSKVCQSSWPVAVSILTVRTRTPCSLAS